MDLKEASDIFAVRLYRWAQAEYVREASLGFPLISRMKCSSAGRFMQALPAFCGQEIELGLARMKMMHPRAVEITHELATEKEKKLDLQFRQLTGKPCAAEAQICRMMGAGTLPSRKGSAKKFTNYARGWLSSLLGENRGSGRYSLSVGPWVLYTSFDADHPPRYLHTAICLRDRIDLRIMDIIYDYLRFFGFGALEYDLILTDDDRREAAESMFQAGSRFINPLPSMLDGLTLDE
jgi:hypothetical protein